MSAAHTPGPWRIDVLAGYSTELIAADGTDVAIFDTDPSEANARLIAAAPELLAALREVLPLIDSQGDAWQSDLVRAAIAKATGAAP